jgi:hypothetical protein
VGIKSARVFDIRVEGLVCLGDETPLDTPASGTSQQFWRTRESSIVGGAPSFVSLEETIVLANEPEAESSNHVALDVGAEVFRTAARWF